MLWWLYIDHSQSENSFVNEFGSYLKLKSSNNVIILGDMNLNLLQEQSSIDEYKLTIASNGFTPLINIPIRINDTSQSCIDHVLVQTNNVNKVKFKAAVTDSF